MGFFWKKKAEEKNKQLLESRIIIIEGLVNDKSASEIVKNMFLLEEYSVNDDIKLYIKTNESTISSMFMIQDNIKHIKAPVATYGIGNIGGLSAMLLSSGTPGKRFAFYNCNITMTPVTKIAKDLENEDEAYLVSMKRKIHEILSNNTGQPVYRIENDSNNLIQLDSQLAKNYGLVDQILESL